MSEQVIVGIDLGTTNSEVAAFSGERVRVLGPGGERSMLPSCVGLSPAGELLVGAPARNQHLLYPERTVRSVKRKMGSDERLQLGERRLTPQEVSALVLRELSAWAGRALGSAPARAVVTVPAYFSDVQRQATREAGDLAGLEVVRILNEPTAASLAFGHGGGRETVMVYDLGGGTFDVSIVRLEGDVTEVLASHGDNQLGGDDFTQLLVDHLADRFGEEHGVDLRQGHPAAHSRLWWAAEEAKQALSAGLYARVREENLLVAKDRPLHLDEELSREDYEGLIRPLIEGTMDSVTRALRDAQVAASALDAVVLVGGSTRTPLVRELLAERSGLEPRQDVHPDLCVALGAGVLASRLSGRQVERILVDVTPYSFGVSHLGERDGRPYPHCYEPIIRRNTALPVTRTKRFFTAAPFQEEVLVEVYQGDDPDALRDVPVGDFMVEGLTPVPEQSEVLCKMRLDLDGILEVTAVEKRTGLTKQVTIERALKPKTDDEIAAARSRLEAIWEGRGQDPETAAVAAGEEAGGALSGGLGETPAGAAEPAAEGEGAVVADDGTAGEAEALLRRCESSLEAMHPDDRADATELEQRVRAALAAGDRAELEQACSELRELLYFVDPG